MCVDVMSENSNEKIFAWSVEKRRVSGHALSTGFDKRKIRFSI
jgi:hypothetical protein